MTADQMRLRGQRIAALVTDGFEQIELSAPVTALEQEGAAVDLIVPQGETAQAWDQNDWGASVTADTALADADARRYAGLLLPGGVLGADRLRLEPRAIAFVHAFIAAGKPIAASGHGAWILISAGAVRGRELTSAPELQSLFEEAGAHWIDRKVVVDDTLITSDAREDLAAFSHALIAVLANERGEAVMRSEAPNASFATGAGRAAIGEDPAALAGNTLGNSAYPEGNTYPQEPEAPRPDERELRERELR
jgi:protease I